MTLALGAYGTLGKARCRERSGIPLGRLWDRIQSRQAEARGGATVSTGECYGTVCVDDKLW